MPKLYCDQRNQARNSPVWLGVLSNWSWRAYKPIGSRHKSPSFKPPKPQPSTPGSGPGGGEKNYRTPPPSKGGPTKNICTKSERLTASCRVTWAWSGRVNLYNRRYYRERQKHTRHTRTPGPVPDRRVPVILTRSPPLPDPGAAVRNLSVTNSITHMPLYTRRPTHADVISRIVWKTNIMFHQMSHRL